LFSLSTGRVTWLHRVPAGIKLLVLLLAGAGVFLIRDPRILGAALAATLVLMLSARLPLRELFHQVLPALVLIAALAAFHIATGEPDLAFQVSARLGVAILLAVLLTMTTRVSAMVEAIEFGLFPLKYIGMSPAKIGLMLSLAIRFIPVLFALLADIREAQRARGLERSVFAVAMPLLVRTLRMADDLAEAIAARGFDAD